MFSSEHRHTATDDLRNMHRQLVSTIQGYYSRGNINPPMFVKRELARINRELDKREAGK